MYEDLIKKIKKKRLLSIIVFGILIFVTLIVCLPSKVTVLDNTFEYNGINPILTIIIIIVFLLIECIIFGNVSLPMFLSMDNEVDPEKHLILNIALNKQKNIDSIYSTDYLYMGDFLASINYADKMIHSNNNRLKVIGYFNKARCEFLMSDYEALQKSVEQYIIILNDLKKNKKQFEVYNKMLMILKLLIAIAKKDKALIMENNSVVAWNNSKATQCYIDYLLGLSACALENKNEAIFRLKSVMNSGNKTVFARLAEEKLTNLSF